MRQHHAHTLLLFISLYVVSYPSSPFALASNVPARHKRGSSHNVPPEGFTNPMDNGGSMLTAVPNTFPAGLGEPLNAIITANSDPAVLVDQQIKGGLRNYFLSVGFSGECLGQHDGNDQAADLGDGNGFKNETAVIRWNYGDPALGSCKETIQGGNHFRYWVQDGSQANTGAIFMGVSYELPISLGHDIIPNGYNLARDWFVGNATNLTVVDTANLTNTTTISGHSYFGGYTYFTSVQYTGDLLKNSSDGINHMYSVGPNGTNAIDGLVAVMTVTITAKNEEAISSSWRTTDSRWTSMWSGMWTTVLLGMALAFIL